MLSSRLPTALIARLLLALVLVCNLTLCIGWHGVATAFPGDASGPILTPPQPSLSHGLHQSGPVRHAAMTPDQIDTASLSCHSGTLNAGTLPGDECQMQPGLSGAASAPPLLGMLLSLLLLPLLLLPSSWSIGPLLDNWLRDPFLRLRGTHPPSWPRRHLMLSVLRH
ncbi:hypothetical protein ACK3Z8_15340 [Aeromonas caviae]|uniref:hypothetical protein n=1 Tax=Aeromonas TaxID=642 RepID=UPI000D695181|nr:MULTISPECIES: hypothetical protein [Aeromonas]MBA8780928.1 hypothetical protein [Aeromonas caviae]MBA8784983.1 hypothetical protein [Aeromonas sp. TW 6]MBL0548172.1 hypothetical protein [Aeromonas caviae]MBP4060692.1 hypothetical protein [Aeromonas sp. Prich7-2]MCR3983978.1 hypothetical protein [Aeromonas caviae]